MIVRTVKPRGVYMFAEYTVKTDSSNEKKTTLPFKAIGVTRVDFSWRVGVGIQQGLSASFLQPWYNEPVTITVDGLSYIGAWGGSTIEESMNTIIKNKRKSAEKAITDAKAALDSGSFSDNAPKNLAGKLKSVSSGAKGPNLGLGVITKALDAIDSIYDEASLMGPYTDTTISDIKELLSVHGSGPFQKRAGVNAVSGIHFIIENEPGSASSTQTFAHFIGYITDFKYSEDVTKPFIYQWSMTFRGTSSAQNRINNAAIEARAVNAELGAVTITSPGSRAYTLFTI